MRCNKKFILFYRYVGGTDYTPTTIGDNIIDLSDSNQIDVIQGTIKRIIKYYEHEEKYNVKTKQ